MSGRVDCESDTEHLLLVEGINDCHAISHMIWLVHGADPTFGIHQCGNDEKVLDKFAASLVRSNPRQKVIGLVLDADIDGACPDEVIANRLAQVKSLASAFYHLPDQFPQDGLTVDPVADHPDAERLPRLGVWLMPNNKAFGMFEDLLLASLSSEASGYTANVVRQAKSDSFARFRDAHFSKAVVHTFLAWQDPPDLGKVGIAIRKGMFPRIPSECKPFLDWLGRLFGTVASSTLP